MLKKLIITIGLTTLALLLMSTMASAYQIDPSYRPSNSPFALSKEHFEILGAAGTLVFILQIITGGLLYFAAPVAIIMIGFAAFSMVIGSHEAEKIEQAKKHLTWSIIGLLAIILSYSIVRIVISLILSSATATPDTPAATPTAAILSLLS